MGDNTCICMGILMWMCDIYFLYDIYLYMSLRKHLYVFMNYFLSHLSFNLLIMFINVPIIMFTSFSNDL